MRVPDKRPDEIPSYTRRGLGTIPEGASPYPMNLSQPANWGEALKGLPGIYKEFDAMLNTTYALSRLPKIQEKVLELKRTAQNTIDPVANPNYAQQVNEFVRRGVYDYINSAEYGLDPSRVDVNKEIQEQVEKWLWVDTPANFEFAAKAQKEHSIREVTNGIQGSLGASYTQFRSDMDKPNGWLPNAKYAAPDLVRVPMPTGKYITDPKTGKRVMEKKEQETTLGRARLVQDGRNYNGARDAIISAESEAQQYNYTAFHNKVFSDTDFRTNRYAIAHDARAQGLQTIIDAANNEYNNGNYDKAISLYSQVEPIVTNFWSIQYVDAKGNSRSVAPDPLLTQEEVMQVASDTVKAGASEGLRSYIYGPEILSAEEQRNFITTAENGIAKANQQKLLKARQAGKTSASVNTLPLKEENAKTPAQRMQERRDRELKKEGKDPEKLKRMNHELHL